MSAEIRLHGKWAERFPVVLCDEADFESLSRYRWHAVHDSRGTGRRRHGPYARALVGDRHIRMHTLLTGFECTDHIDGNGLNNCRANLRPATPGQNAANRPSRLGSTSRYLGVHWKRDRNKWRAKIGKGGSERVLGQFDSEVEAAQAYDKAARELHGEFARLNFPERGAA